MKYLSPLPSILGGGDSFGWSMVIVAQYNTKALPMPSLIIRGQDLLGASDAFLRMTMGDNMLTQDSATQQVKAIAAPTNAGTELGVQYKW